MGSPPPFPPFTAVLLAGGKSTRMGFDKAGALVAGQPLWQWQLAKLRALGPTEIFISGHSDGPYSNAGIRIVPDTVPGLGPLAGIAAALRRSTSPLVLVLAIDLPAITVDFLAALIAEAHSRGTGIVPQSPRGFEPLAAVYPRAALSLAEAALGGADRSLQGFVRSLIAAKLVKTCELRELQLAQFRNVNTPADLLGGSNEA